MLVIAHRLVLEGSVDFRMLNQTYGDNLYDQIVNAEFQIRIEFIERMAHIGGAFHIDLNGEKEMWDRTDGRDQPPCDRPAHFADRLIAISRRAIDRAFASRAGN